jgi:pimeloyl-ACP methyl ester carboxylesterase
MKAPRSRGVAVSWACTAALALAACSGTGVGVDLRPADRRSAEPPPDRGRDRALTEAAADSAAIDAGSLFCRRASACASAAATCNLCSGSCEPRAATAGTAPSILGVYPAAGAPGDLLVIDGEGFSGRLWPDFTATVAVGGAIFNFFALQVDQNRIVLTRTSGATGAIAFSGQSGKAAGPAVETSALYAGATACQAGDPPATGKAGPDPSTIGPHAAGFADSPLQQGLRVHYPAMCGGLRRPVAQGSFPLVLILHGDGCVFLNYEHLARHLASWGHLVVVPQTSDAATLQAILDAALGAPQTIYGGLTGASAGGGALVIGHSMGADRTGQLLKRGEKRIAAALFLGPVSQTIHYPLPGMVIGATADLQSTPGTYTPIYGALAAPRLLAVLQGGNHSQFTDDKHWEGLPRGDEAATMSRNRQFEIVQALALAYAQRVLGQAQLFPQVLTSAGFPLEVVWQSRP